MKRFQTAFTLLELMITLVILAIMVTISVPSFTALIVNNRSVTTAQNVVNAIRLARSEALKRTRLIAPFVFHPSASRA